MPLHREGYQTIERSALSSYICLFSLGAGMVMGGTEIGTGVGLGVGVGVGLGVE